jgi:hypothetical protein
VLRNPDGLFGNCGVCAFCLDKVEFGGPGVKNQRCIVKQKALSRMAAGEEPWRTSEYNAEYAVGKPAQYNSTQPTAQPKKLR